MSKKSKLFRFLLWTCLVTTFNSCVFYKTVSVPVNQSTLNVYLLRKPIWTITDATRKKTGITDIYIRNDSIIGKSYPANFPDHREDRNVYRKKKVEHSRDHLHLYAANDTLIKLSKKIKIPIESITYATTHEKDVGTTVFANVVVLIPAGVATIAILAAAVASISGSCGCPHVKLIGVDTTLLQGSLFPGAISKSFERPDNLIMKTVPLNQAGKISVSVLNELPEIEYFNQVELFEVRDMPHSTLGMHASGYPVSYTLQDHLLSAATPDNLNIKEDVQAIQGGFYDFNEQGTDDELDKIFLTFDRANLTNDAMLIVRAKQSKWMETVAAFTLQQFGAAYDTWVKRLDNADPKKYNQNTIDRGISMNAYVKQNNQWNYIGSFSNAGTLTYRDLALNLDLSNTSEGNIEIKLEAAHRFWDIDYVGITDEWSEKVSLEKLNTISAMNNDGTDVMHAIAANDALHTELETEGAFINLLFEAPSDPNANFILTGKGYYHYKIKSNAKPNYKFLMAVKRDKMSSHQLSRLLQSQLNVAATKIKNP